MQVQDLLQHAIAAGASDLHLKVGHYPMMRVHGSLMAAGGDRRLTAPDTARFAAAVLPPAYQKKFEDRHEIDFAYDVQGLGRFRCNVFRQRGTVALVFRVIQTRIPSFEELRLPPVIERIAREERGLVLVTGTTTSGKSTTIAAMLDYINARRSAHIITIEDPIEFLHADKQSIVNQREVDIDTRTFGDALRSALRQDPDVIMVGEMRDLQTIETALLAAETGHLVYSTLHTVDAAETVNRIIAAFPTHYQAQVRLQLASVLKAVISLRLLERADGNGRCPAVEVMISTAYMRDCIANKDKTHLISGAIASGTYPYGMQTFDQSIFKLYQARLVSYEEALRYASSPDEFKLKAQGVASNAELGTEGTDVDDASGIIRYSR